MTARKYEIDMLNGPLLGKILKFALPMMLSGVLQLFFNAADVIVVGRFDSSNALAAVGSTTSLILLITNLFLGLSVGANVVAARYYGAQRKKDVSETVHTAVLMSIIVGGIVAVIGLVFSPVFLEWMDTPPEIIDMASTYMRIIFIGMPATMMYDFGYAVLRVSGDTRRPLYFLLISGGLNVGLNLFLVIVCNLSVAGVAIATSTAQALSAFLILRTLVKEKGMLHLDLKKLHLHMHKFKQIVVIGLPAGIQGVVFSVSNVLIQSTVNSFGATVVAGNTAAANIEGFVYFAMNPFSHACITFTSQNVGAGNYRRISKILLISMLSCVVVGALLSLMVILFQVPLLSVYSPDPAVIEAGVVRFACIMLTYPLLGPMEVLAGSIRGMGHSLAPMIITIMFACVFRIFWIYVVFPTTGDISTLYYSYPISWALADAIYVVFFFVFRHKLVKTQTTVIQ